MSPLARHAVVLMHAMAARPGREEFLGFVGGRPALGVEPGDEGGLAEFGDRVETRGGDPQSNGRRMSVEAVTWNHDPEATVLGQQPDAPSLREGLAVTDFYELRSGGGAPQTRRLPRIAGRRRQEPESLAADRGDLADLLEVLHRARDERGQPRYDRVMVVGHRGSAGAALAGVRLCWQRRQASPATGPVRAASVTGARTPSAEARTPSAGASARSADPVGDLDLVVAGEDVALALATTGADPDPRALAERRSVTRQAKDSLYRLLRDQPEPARWVVSDLITLGSPGPVPPRTFTPTDEDAVPPPVRWTNIRFRHDPGGHWPASMTGQLEDVVLESSRRSRWAAVSAAGYWSELSDGGSREGSRLSIAMLRRLVRRRPTLLLALHRPPDPAQVAALQVALDQAADYPTARGAVMADVRIVVGEDLATATGWPAPIAPVPVPATIALRGVKELLGPGGRVVVLLSSELLPPLNGG